MRSCEGCVSCKGCCLETACVVPDDSGCISIAGLVVCQESFSSLQQILAPVWLPAQQPLIAH